LAINELGRAQKAIAVSLAAGQIHSLSSPLAFDGMGDSPHNKNRGNRVKYWEAIADKLSKAGWSLGWVSAVDSEGRTIWIGSLVVRRTGCNQ
jgi:hypothetical protein